PSDAIFINAVGQACIPGGTCRKWFGRCTTTLTHTPVTFSTFDDGNANQTMSSDATFINGDEQVCIPGGANGICRKWFGSAITQDGRSVLCSVFSDGYSDILGPTDEIFSWRTFGVPLLETQLCLPTGSGASCRKWFGRCVVSDLNRFELPMCR